MTSENKTTPSGRAYRQVGNNSISTTPFNTGRRSSFFDRDRIGIRNDNPQMNNASESEQTSYWRTVVTFWGGLWGLLLGAAFLWAPIVSPFLLAGLAIVWIVIAVWRTKDSIRGVATTSSIKLRRSRRR
jgi:hypothetical protein